MSDAPTDWIITLPKTIKWEDYKKELDSTRDGKTLMNYRLPRRVYAEEGDRCFVTWNNKVRGWMQIFKVWNAPYGWTCSTTGKEWPGGWYLQRGGLFHAIEERTHYHYPGFRGIRRFPDGKLLSMVSDMDL